MWLFTPGTETAPVHDGRNPRFEPEFDDFRFYTAPIIYLTRCCCPLPKEDFLKRRFSPAGEANAAKVNPPASGRLRQILHVTLYVSLAVLVNNFYAKRFHFRWSFLSLDLTRSVTFQLIWVVCMPKLYKIVESIFEFDAKIVGAIGAKALTIWPAQRSLYKKLRSHFYKLFFTLLSLKLVAMFIFLIDSYTLDVSELIYVALSKTVDSVPMYVTLCLYVYFSENTRIRFDVVVQLWDTLEKTEVKINSYRLLYTQLFHTMSVFNDCFSFPLVAFFGTVAYSLFLNFFLLFQYYSLLSLLIFFVIDIVCIHLLTFYTKALTLSSEKNLRRLLSITINSFDERKISQVRMFIWELHAKRARITAFGLFVIDGDLVTSIMLSTASFLVMMFQLMPQLTEEMNG